MSDRHFFFEAAHKTLPMRGQTLPAHRQTRRAVSIELGIWGDDGHGHGESHLGGIKGVVAEMKGVACRGGLSLEGCKKTLLDGR